jgi:hypothetical protein
VLSSAPYISLLFVLSTSVIAVNLAAPLANPPEGETSTSDAQLEKHCVASLGVFQWDSLHRGLFGWVHGFVFNRRDLEMLQHHEPSTMKGPLWWKGRDVVEDSSVFGDFL